MSVLEAALAARAAGLSVIPIKTDGSKEPSLTKWGPYQLRRATEQEIRAWFRADPARGMALVGGKVSNYLEMFEFEGRAVEAGIRDEFRRCADQLGLGDLLTRIETGWLDESPSGGFHLHWQCVDAFEGSRALALRPSTEEELAADPLRPKQLLIEVRGEGQYFIVAPTNGRVHATGRPWKRVCGGIGTIATITGEERQALLDLARSFDQMPPAVDNPPPAPRGTTPPTGELRPGDDFNTRADWADILVGWTYLFTASGGRQYWRRPGKDNGHSATITADGEVLIVFSTSVVPLVATIPGTPKGYTKFSAYATLHHGGDYRAAAKALAVDGYGEKTGEIRRGGVSGGVPQFPAVPEAVGTAMGAAGSEPTTSLPTKEYVVGGRLAEFNGADLAALTDDDIKLTYLPLLGQDGWLVEGWSHLVAGYPRCGKTELLIRVVREWLELGYRVLYISEESKPTWALRLRDLSGDWSGLQIVCGLGVDPAILLERAFSGTEGVVIADTLRNLLQLQDEKDNSEIARKVNPWVAAAREAERTLVMAHHDRKGFGEHGEAIAGGHALLGAFDIAIEVRFDADSPERRLLENHPRLIDHKRMVYEKRDGEFKALGDPGSLRLEEVRKRVLEALTAEPQKLRDIREAMDDPRPGVDTLRQALSALAAENRARRDPDISIKDVKGKTVLWRLPASVPGGRGSETATGEDVTNLPPTSDHIVGSEVAEYEQANVDEPLVPQDPPRNGLDVTAQPDLLQPCVRCHTPTAFAIGQYPVCNTAPCRPAALELLRSTAVAAR